MKTAQILHGSPDKEEFFSDQFPSPSNSHWLPWLQKQCLQAGILAQTPELPSPYDLEYSAWRTVFEQNPADEETLLIGHSRGGGFLLRWLSENTVTVARTILVAPNMDPERKRTTDFFDFKIDPDLCSRTELHILYSDNDMPSTDRSVDIIKAALPRAQYHFFKNYGHFTLKSMKTDTFPELANIALKGSIS